MEDSESETATELLIGEVTPEVKAFLESMGRKVLTPGEEVAVWQATQQVGRPRWYSRHVVHDPPAWSPGMVSRWPHVHQACRLEFLRLEVLNEFEVGSRVASSYSMQQDFYSYLASLPAHIGKSSSTEGSEEA